MFGAGYNLMVTLADGIISGGIAAITEAANFVASLIASFFIGASPPPAGPLSEITHGGQALMESYGQGMMSGLNFLDTVATGISDAFGNVNKMMSVEEGRAGLAAAAGNATALKAAAEDAEGAIRTIDRALRELD